VGYHCRKPLSFRSQSALEVETRGIPHLTKNERDLFLCLTSQRPDEFAYAVGDAE
jgi:hypothetical protein